MTSLALHHISTADVTVASGDTALVAVQFEYSQRDPYAVHLTLDRLDSRWCLARETLVQAYDEPAGEGHVHCSVPLDPAEDRMYVTMVRPDEGKAMTLAIRRAGSLRRWLERTYELVPRGTESEHIDLDALVARLLEGAK